MLDLMLLTPGDGAKSTCVQALPSELERVCAIAHRHKVKTVCVHGLDVLQVVDLLTGSGVVSIAVIDFPSSCGDKKILMNETIKAFRDGAQEIDMVFNYRAYLARRQRSGSGRNESQGLLKGSR